MMDHDGSYPFSIAIGHAYVKPLGKHQIQLDGAALPISALAVGQDKLELWAIERAIARLYPEREPCCSGRGRQGSFSFIPSLVRSLSIVRPCRQAYSEFIETQSPIHSSQ